MAGALVPLNQCMGRRLDAPSQPVQYLAILVLHQALDDAANTGPKPTASERLDAIEFVRGDWRLALWCDAARITPELVQQAAVIVPVPATTLALGKRLGWDNVREIRAQRAAGVPQRVLAERYGVCAEAILRIVRGESWREVTECAES